MKIPKIMKTKQRTFKHLVGRTNSRTITNTAILTNPDNSIKDVGQNKGEKTR